MKQIKIRLTRAVTSDLPAFISDAKAKPGVYVAEMNGNGALSVECAPGERIGIKPGEFEFATLDDMLEYNRRFPGALAKVSPQQAISILTRLHEAMRSVASYPCNTIEATVCNKCDESRGNHEIKSIGMVFCFPCYIAGVLGEFE